MLKVELLQFKQICRASMRHSVDGFRDVRLSKADRRVAKPFSLSMFGNMFTTSNDTRTAPSGKPVELIWSIISNRCDVSFILDGSCVVKGAE